MTSSARRCTRQGATNRRLWVKVGVGLIGVLTLTGSLAGCTAAVISTAGPKVAFVVKGSSVYRCQAQYQSVYCYRVHEKSGED